MNIFQTVPKATINTGFIVLLSSFLLFSCEKSSDNSDASFSTQLDLPESLTGPKVTTAITAPLDNKKTLDKSSHSSTEKTSARGVQTFVSTHATEENAGLFQCEYMGPEDDDIFQNGYKMTQFMTSAVATWSCIGDSIIYITSVMPHDNIVHQTEHDGAAENYDPEEPTHYKISEDEEGKVEVRLYYGYSHSEELPGDALIGFYFAWVEQGEGIIGKMIIDAEATDNPANKEGDPVKVRMDFNYNEQQKKADMYMIFDENNIWADGFRIQVIKDLTAPDNEKVFTAIGKIDMTAQFSPAAGITEVPEFNVYTVSNAAGDGAARAEFSDLSLPLEINVTNHLGNYLADKVDIYFFNEDSDWDWIDKSFVNSVYRGGRVLSDITLNGIENFIGLDPTYFDTECLDVDDDCNVLINAIFQGDFYGQEFNQGEDPDDWRSLAIGSATYLGSVLPEGSETWDGVFDPVF